MERDRRLDALDDGHLERAPHPRDRFLAVAPVHDDLGDQRIVVRRNGALGVREGVDPYAGAAGHAEGANHAGRRGERLRVFGVDAALDRVAGERDVPLLERQPLARGDPDLLLDDVDAGQELGDRMLDLEAGVHLEEIEVALVVEEELEGPGVGVLDGARSVDDGAAQFAAHAIGERDGRRLLDQLLVAPLDRALALAEVHHRAVLIAEHLHFDVARVLDVLLDVDVTVAERRFRLALRGLERLAHLAGVADDPHAAAAAAGDRLDDHREAQLAGDLEGLLFAVDRPVAAGQDRHAGLLHRAPRAGLVAEQPDDVRRRADELDVAGLADFGEVGALREEPVAGMDRVGAGDLGRAQHRRDAEIAVGAPGRADAHVLVGEPHVQRVLVGLGVHGDGRMPSSRQAQMMRRAISPRLAIRIFLNMVAAALGSGRAQVVLIANSRSPSWTGLPFST